MKKMILIFLSACFVFSGSYAQDISGTWEGLITQDEGGVAAQYTFKIFLKASKADEVSGTAFVALEDMGIYASMRFSGTFDGTYLILKEEKILREKMVEDFFWCLKEYRLKLLSSEKLRLEGRWSGYTRDGSCVPGEIYLTKSIPRV